MMHVDRTSPRVGGAVPLFDTDSFEWVRELGVASPNRDEAIARLHDLLLRGARSEAHRRISQLRIEGPEVDDLVHQAADDALVAIIGKLDRFRGDSLFTTWAFKFVVYEVSTKFSRHFWRRPTVPMGTEEWERLPDRFGFEPDEGLERRELIAAVHQAVEAELTDHQRQVFAAIVLNGVPIDVLVAELGTNRNAIYKTMFDARRKLRTFLAANGQLGKSDSRRV
jgi:RNA polymerase sigma-70 factor (ECF subfamily)